MGTLIYPAVLDVYLTLFRMTHNLIYVGDGGRTPIRRLGFADEPMRYEDILWPGEPEPRHKAVRREERKIKVQRRRRA